MDKQDIDFDRIRARLRLFWDSPNELVLGAWASTSLAGFLSCAYRNVERDMASVQQSGFSGFHVAGVALWLAVAAFGTACLSRRRPSFNVPRLYCDRAAYAMALFALIRIYIFLQSSETQTGGFFWALSTFHLYFTPGFGIVFLLAGPALLWRATRIERRVETDGGEDAATIVLPLATQDHVDAATNRDTVA